MGQRTAITTLSSPWTLGFSIIKTLSKQAQSKFCLFLYIWSLTHPNTNMTGFLEIASLSSCVFYLVDAVKLPIQLFRTSNIVISKWSGLFTLNVWIESYFYQKSKIVEFLYTEWWSKFYMPFTIGWSYWTVQKNESCVVMLGIWLLVLPG